jgi:hypothetical protein
MVTPGVFTSRYFDGIFGGSLGGARRLPPDEEPEFRGASWTATFASPGVTSVIL